MAYAATGVTESTGRVVPRDTFQRFAGLGALGAALAGVLALAWLLGRHPGFPVGLSRLGVLLGALLLVLYLARLIVLDPRSPLLLVPVLLTGFLVNPAWYGWLGLALWRADRQG